MRALAFSTFVVALVSGCTVGAVDPCAGVTCLDALPATTSAAGGEQTVFRVTLPEPGFVAARVDAVGASVCLRDALAGECLDTHPTRVGALLPAGEIFVEVTAPAGAEVAVHVGLTTPGSLEALGVQHEAALDALTALGHAWAWGATRRHEYAIVDFSMHSADPREWIVDLATGELLHHLRVAHGRGSSDPSDLAHAVTFSNLDGSHQSSLGLYRSSGTYTGTYGYSFRLEGLEPGVNDAVCARDIVMHPWAPMGDEYVARCGWARPSFGCPAIDDTLATPVVDRMARPDGLGTEEGALYFFWYPDDAWRTSSAYLRTGAPSDAVRAQLSVVCDSSQDSTPTPPASGDYACD